MQEKPAAGLRPAEVADGMDPQTIKDLLNTQAYPEPTRSVHLIQTHVSFLFITDEYVYKVKKPVDFGFLNFTTLDRRRFYCEEEVRLNRRLCPDIYLGVVGVRDSLSGATFCGDGAVVDYAVKMKRLPEERMLDRLLAAEEATEEDMRRIAETIAEFHLRADKNGAISDFGTEAAIRYNWEENFRQLEPYSGITLRKQDLELIRDRVERFITGNRQMLAERVAEGFIRDCDGDIHLENICLTDKVCIFDCIEFNSRFRYSDTAADLAFLLMDLDYHGRSRFSTIILEEYIAATGDAGMLGVLDFYKAYRAFVRGKVETFRLDDPIIPPIEKDAAKEKASRYFRLARGYMIRNELPLSIIITCGIMGSGKSTVAARLGLELGLDIVSSDRIRKELTGTPLSRHNAEMYGAGIYTPTLTDATYDELLNKGEEALAEGRSVIIDATFRRKSDRERFRSLARKRSALFTAIVAECPEQLARERLEQRSHDPSEISDGRWELYHRQKEEFERPGEHEEGFVFIDTSTPVDDNIDIILDRMGLIR